MTTEERAELHIVETYEYEDANGHHVYDVVRFTPKTFRQRLPDGRWGLHGTPTVLYHLPEILAAKTSEHVWLTEGEKDADYIRAKCGKVATCNPMGAGKWKETYTADLADTLMVEIVEDQDDPGRAHAQAVAQSLQAAGIPCQIRKPTTGKDAWDHLHAGHALDDMTTVPLRPATPVATNGHQPGIERRQLEDMNTFTPAGGGRRFVVEHLWPRHGILAFIAGEGAGKTYMLNQIAREVIRGDYVLGVFAPGDAPAARILYLDTEQTDEDIALVRDDLARRLPIPDGKLALQIAVEGMNLGESIEDRLFVEERLASSDADALMIDAFGNALGSDPNDVSIVRSFFNWLLPLQQDADVACALDAHPRKQSQEGGIRKFDDVFGSREFKGRVSKALYMDRTSITVWKDRGGDLTRLWKPKGGAQPKAVLLRPGETDTECPPFRIGDVIIEEHVDLEALGDAIIEYLERHPDEYNKTKLKEAFAKENKVGVNPVYKAINMLIEAERIVGVSRKPTLRVAE